MRTMMVIGFLFIAFIASTSTSGLPPDPDTILPSDCYTQNLDCRTSNNKINHTLILIESIIDPSKALSDCKAFCDEIEGCQNWTLTTYKFSVNMLECFALSSCSNIQNNSVLASGPRVCDVLSEEIGSGNDDYNYCCPMKQVGNDYYFFVRKDPIVASQHYCKNDCIYMKYPTITLVPVRNQYGDGYGWDYTEYCFKNGKLPSECIYDENVVTNAATTITIVNAVTLAFNVDVTFYGSTTEVSDELEPGPSYGTLDKPQGATKVKKIFALSGLGTPHQSCHIEFPPQGSTSTVFGICPKTENSCYICAGPGCCFVATGKI